MADKLDRFTKVSLAVLRRAQGEAMRLHHNYISTEHFLLALLREERGVAYRALAQLEVDTLQLIMAVERAVGRGERTSWGKLALAPHAKQVIELAVDEARNMGHTSIGTEHLLLGLLQENESTGGKVLRAVIEIEPVRKEITKILTQGQNDDANLWNAFLQQSERLYRVLGGRPTIQFPDQNTDAAVQAERTRLARDLHDSIKQQLFSISVSAAAVRERWATDPAGALAALDDVQQSARGAMIEMDALLKQLRPNPLETTSLIEALREQCEALAFRTGAEVTSHFDELPAEAALPLATHETLFRIVQEALANIARHARANQVHVRLETDVLTQVVRLLVRDNGQGFDPSHITPGMGLANMKQRAHSLQGLLGVESFPGYGTTVWVEIPLA